MKVRGTVHVVDGELSGCDSLRALVRTVGLSVRSYAGPVEFLKERDRNRPACVILDLRMPDMSGLDLQAALNARANDIPLIFRTAFGDVQTAIQAMKAGAFGFLEKPCADQLLLEEIQAAIAVDRKRMLAAKQRRNIKTRLGKLTSREREIAELIAKGEATKQIAAKLSLSVKTIEAHRSHILHKLDADGTAELVGILLADRVCCGKPVLEKKLSRKPPRPS